MTLTKRETDNQIREYVATNFEHLQSSGVFRRLKALVDSWHAEERGKANVAVRAFLGFVALLAFIVVMAVLFEGVAAGGVATSRALFIGFFSAVFTGCLVWIAFVFYLVSKFLR
jgi:hypothetical protein